MSSKLIGLFGIICVLGTAWLCSRNRKAIKWKPILMGLLLQIAFAIAILGIPSLGVPGIFRFIFEFLSFAMSSLVDFTMAGSKFLFGELAEAKDPWGFVFAFRALPTIIFFSALMSGLYYMGVLQSVVKFFAWIMQKTMKTSGAETLSNSANIFMGQTEAPLLIKPYISKLTTSEMYCIMVGGMATIASGVEGAYIGLLRNRISDIAGHLLTASVMATFAAMAISKIIYPEVEEPETSGNMHLPEEEKVDANIIESISRGASEGVHLALNVGAMLIAFIALIAIFDALIAKAGVWMNLSDPISFSILVGKMAQPVAWILGIPWNEAAEVGRLLGEKVVLNEFVAFIHLAEVGTKLSDRTVLIAVYALCGFANFASIGIQIGGIGGMAPNQKSKIAKLGLMAVLGGNLACFLSACVAGLLF